MKSQDVIPVPIHRHYYTRSSIGKAEQALRRADRHHAAGRATGTVDRVLLQCGG